MTAINLVNLSLQARIDLIKKFCIDSNIGFISISRSDSRYFSHFVFLINNTLINCHFLLKNIIKSGWPSKPFMKRIEVPSLNRSDLHSITNKSLSCLVGFVYINECPYICVWNPFRYTFHKTVRSCYVSDESLLAAANIGKGFYRTSESGNPIIICDNRHFERLIKEFITHNAISE